MKNAVLAHNNILQKKFCSKSIETGIILLAGWEDILVESSLSKDLY